MFYAIVELGDTYVKTCVNCPLTESCKAYKDWLNDIDDTMGNAPSGSDSCMIKEIVDADT